MKYGIRITKKVATIHVGELSDRADSSRFVAGAPSRYLGYGYINGVWFGSPKDIFDTEEAATAEIRLRMEEAVSVAKGRLKDVKDRLNAFDWKGPRFKR